MEAKGGAILGILVTLAIAGLAWWRFSGPGNAQIVSMIVGGLIMGWLLLLNILYVATAQEVVASFMTVLLGCTIGLIIGALISPWDEDKGFGTLTAAIGSLLTGYIAGKADPLIAKVLDPAFVLNMRRAFLLASFSIAIGASGVMTYAARTYLKDLERTQVSPAAGAGTSAEGAAFVSDAAEGGPSDKPL